MVSQTDLLPMMTATRGLGGHSSVRKAFCGLKQSYSITRRQKVKRLPAAALFSIMGVFWARAEKPEKGCTQAIHAATSVSVSWGQSNEGFQTAPQDKSLRI